MNDPYDDKIDATRVECPSCGESTYWEFEMCPHCGWDLNEEFTDE